MSPAGDVARADKGDVSLVVSGMLRLQLYA